MSTTSGSRVLSRFRPSEWMALGFFAYCAIRVAFGRRVPFDASYLRGFPSSEIVASLLFVAALKLVRRYLKEAGGRNRFLMPATLLLGGALLYSFGWVSSSLTTLAPGAISQLRSLRYLLLAIGAFGALGLWGRIHLARHEALRLGAFAREGADGVWRELRAWWPLLVTLLFYPLVPNVLQATATGDRDSLLAAADRLIFFGADPTLLFEKAISNPLSEWMAFCYTAYGIVFLAVVLTLYFRENPEPFRRLIFALTSAFVIGYVGYTLVPAQGPIFTQHFHVSLDLYYMKDIKAALMDRTRIDRDCFPSLHTCISLILESFCWKYARPLFWVFLPVVASIPVACVYLRYHYVVDVIAGALLSVAICWAALPKGRVIKAN